MKESIKTFLEFNGKPMYFTCIEGTWWVALKPLCEALNVGWEHQRRMLKEDKIINQLPCNYTVVATES